MVGENGRRHPSHPPIIQEVRALHGNQESLIDGRDEENTQPHHLLPHMEKEMQRVAQR